MIATDKGRTAVLVMKDAPSGAAWQSSGKDGKGPLLLRVPVVKDQETKMTLWHWSPLDDKPATAEKSAVELLGK